MKEVSEGLDKALEHENYPFAEVSAKWGFGINVMYEYQRGIVEKPDIPGLIKLQKARNTGSEVGITVRIVDKADGPAIEAEYNDALYTENAINEFIKSYAIVLEKFTKYGRNKLRSITLLDKEREELLGLVMQGIAR